MSATNPIAWTAIEDAIHTWVVRSTGLAGQDVRLPAPREDGGARGAPGKAEISLISLVETSQQGRKKIPSIVRQRYTVIADGPGTVGINFFEGDSLVPQPISIVAGVGDPPATSATALLVALAADLPAGYSAAADIDDAASVFVVGSTGEPLFAALPVDEALLAVATTMPRFPVLTRIQITMVWRVTFRSSDVSGETTAAANMSKAHMGKRSLLDKPMYALGFASGGSPLTTANIPAARNQSDAAIDVRFIGLMTGAEAAIAMRAVGLTQTAA